MFVRIAFYRHFRPLSMHTTVLFGRPHFILIDRIVASPSIRHTHQLSYSFFVLERHYAKLILIFTCWLLINLFSDYVRNRWFLAFYAFALKLSKISDILSHGNRWFFFLKIIPFFKINFDRKIKIRGARHHFEAFQSVYS